MYNDEFIVLKADNITCQWRHLENVSDVLNKSSLIEQYHLQTLPTNVWFATLRRIFLIKNFSSPELSPSKKLKTFAFSTIANSMKCQRLNLFQAFISPSSRFWKKRVQRVSSEAYPFEERSALTVSAKRSEIYLAKTTKAIESGHRWVFKFFLYQKQFLSLT